MIPTSRDLERHPVLGAVMIIAFSVLVIAGAVSFGDQPINLGLEIDWEALLPTIIKFAAEVAVAAFTMFKMIKPIEARLDVVESRLDAMREIT